MPRFRRIVPVGLITILLPANVHAHGFGEDVAGTAWSGLTAVVLLFSATIASRAYQLRIGRAGTRRFAALFATGWLVLAIALFSPIDFLGEALFSIHMVQHVLVMNIAVPLLLLARPERYFPAAVPRVALAWSSARFRPRITAAWRQISSIETGLVLNAIVIWAWHVPAAHGWALRSSTAHTMQHLSFALGALVFWAGIWRAIGRARSGIAILSLFLTAVHTGVLGAFLTFSDSLWYAGYTPELFGIAPVADQQLAGLVMWIPGGFAYVTAALLLMTNWLRLSEQQVR